MKNEHYYKTTTKWTGNQGSGTSSYTAYERSYSLSVENKPIIQGSSDPAFHGDSSKFNPEELLLASLSSCHMLWYLHLCSEAGVIVIDYEDYATGIMTQTSDGGGHFKEVTLNPIVIVKEDGMIQLAKELHHKANELCFIARSVNFSVKHIVQVKAEDLSF